MEGFSLPMSQFSMAWRSEVGSLTLVLDGIGFSEKSFSSHPFLFFFFFFFNFLGEWVGLVVVVEEVHFWQEYYGKITM